MALAQLTTLWQKSGEKASAGHLPRWRQWLEIITLYLLRRQGPNYYFAARFFRRSISFRDKWRHCDDREWEAFIDAVNAPLYQKTSQHKLLEKAVLTFAGVPTPSFAGFIHSMRGYRADHAPLCNDQQADAFFRQHLGKRLCFKGVEGFGGMSFRALNIIEQQGQIVLQHPISAKVFSLSEFLAPLWQDHEGTLVEHYLQQHPLLASFNPDSVNTVRLWLGEIDGRFETFGAFLRVGRRGTQVDNTSMGGLMCPIDRDSGKLLEVRQIKTGESFSHHPDTGAEMLGVAIPFWPQVIEASIKAVCAFPHMRFAGLDIAVGEHGPMIIELNVNPDRRGATHLDMPHKDMFERMLHSPRPQ